MNESLIREIAEQIVRNQILENWKLYVLLGALGILTSFTGNWLSSYFKKRAETYATKADMQEVLTQVRATTHATEQVRVAVSHADWVTKEWNTTRRMKLEELLANIYELEHWLEKQRNIWMYDKENTCALDPIDKVKLLGTLYFPELFVELNTVTIKHREAFLAILGVARRTSDLGQDLSAKKTELDTFTQQWGVLYAALQLAIQDLEAKASTLMVEITSV